MQQRSFSSFEYWMSKMSYNHCNSWFSFQFTFKWLSIKKNYLRDNFNSFITSFDCIMITKKIKGRNTKNLYYITTIQSTVNSVNSFYNNVPSLIGFRSYLFCQLEWLSGSSVHFTSKLEPDCENSGGNFRVDFFIVRFNFVVIGLKISKCVTHTCYGWLRCG